MDTQKYEAVRKAVIAAVPEIMDLKFGCQVRMNLGNIDGMAVIENYYFGDNKFSTCHSERLYNRIDIYEILGRPIRLADVLLALEGVTNNSGYLVLTGKMNFEESKRWNYRQDDLSLQSPECIDFLHSILVK